MRHCLFFYNALRDWKVQTKAFTLVEMLVVIAIISILASLLMPAISEAVAQSYIVSCANNQKQILMASKMYADDNHNFFPYQFSGASYNDKDKYLINDPLSIGQNKSWVYAISPYLAKSYGVLVCSGNSGVSAGFPPNDRNRFSYHANGLVTHFGSRRFKSPSKVAAFADESVVSSYSIVRPFFSGSIPTPTERLWTGWMRFGSGVMFSDKPHDGRVMGFLDGHAQRLFWDEITCLKYGLLINGKDTYEQDVSGYSTTSRCGTAAYNN